MKWPALYMLPAALSVAATGFALHSVLERNSLKNKFERLLDSLKKLPADEQWLGISVSSLTFRHNSMATHLLDVCKRRGIGVITVGKRAKVVFFVGERRYPRPFPHFYAKDAFAGLNVVL